MSERMELPEGWVSEKMVNIALINPKLPFEKIDDELMVSFLPMKNVEEESNRIRLTDKKKFREVKKGFTPMTDGDVIFAKITPCMENGKIAVVHSLLNQIAFGSTEFHVFRPDNRILLNHFLFYYLVQKQTRQLAAQQMTGAVGQRRVPKNYLEILEIPLPPLPEQHRIVAKIEALFTSLDRGIASLKTAQQQLKIYRQAVLKWAFEGKLTNGRVKDGELPEGWKWVKIDKFLLHPKKGMATGPFGTALKKEEHQKSGIPVLGIENIGEGKFKMPNKIYVTREKAIELQAFQVYTNDIIISRSGTVGEICSVPEKMNNALISTNLIRVRLNQDIIAPKFFVYIFQGGAVREQVEDLCKGSTRAFLNQTILNSLSFPYCKLEEQHQIVAAIESRLSVCDKLEETIMQSLQQAEALRQSILKKAFAGQLVPQDPNDEPASVLLGRIRAERKTEIGIKTSKTK